MALNCWGVINWLIIWWSKDIFLLFVMMEIRCTVGTVASQSLVLLYRLFLSLLQLLLIVCTIKLLRRTFILLYILLVIYLFCFTLLLILLLISDIISAFFHQFFLLLSSLLSLFFDCRFVMMDVILDFTKHFLIDINCIVVIIDKILLWLTDPWLFCYHVNVGNLWVIETLFFLEIRWLYVGLIIPC